MSRPDATESEVTRRLLMGRYRLDRRLGAGGFGVVWQAYDARLERDVAIKVVPRGRDRDESRRVEREALAAARLNHPGIVALYELGADEEDVYLVSELVDGATLDELIHEQALSDRDVARIGLALCDALEHAHARGVIHRDVKPGNVMVVAEPAAGAGFAKLTDFGIARLSMGEDLTATGDIVGTLAYMAPEQAEGRRVTQASDVYSLALTLYEAWSGTNPVRAGSPARTARRLGAPLPPLEALRADLPAALRAVVDAALDPDPERRPAIDELRGALRAATRSLEGEGGLVEPGTLRRHGLAPARPQPRLPRLRWRQRTQRPPADEDASPGRGARTMARAAAGLATGALVVAALEALGPSPPFSSLAAGAAAAVVTTLMPRTGWMLSGLVVCAWLMTEAGRPGTALVVGVALLATPLLLPRAPLLWCVAALAPLLGAAALAPLFVGVAALAPTAWRRAGLAAAGFLWLALAEVVSGSELLFGAADGTLPRSEWEGSPLDAAGDALLPLASSPAVAPVAVWVAFAVVLPLLVRGRWAAADLAAGALWALGLVAAHGLLGDLLAATTELDSARGAAAGAALGALVAVCAALIAPPRVNGGRDPALP